MSERPTASLVKFTCRTCHGMLWAFDRPPDDLKDVKRLPRVCPYCDYDMIAVYVPLNTTQFRKLQDALRVY